MKTKIELNLKKKHSVFSHNVYSRMIKPNANIRRYWNRILSFPINMHSNPNDKSIVTHMAVSWQTNFLGAHSSGYLYGAAIFQEQV